ncbi:hypothetical protein Pcinc_037809 [Petrolisthes cinctipes]|uniref:Uncharacterized protein n=1 Tax=Petrolisthes cinctipes TaxID=88211 RepID=A0AAE1BSR8_PETCI|nr:hypothetical protein Pcinc_037809 [Petrolisthes cinctipes]
MTTSCERLSASRKQKHYMESTKEKHKTYINFLGETLIVEKWTKIYENKTVSEGTMLTQRHNGTSRPKRFHCYQLTTDRHSRQPDTATLHSTPLPVAGTTFPIQHSSNTMIDPVLYYFDLSPYCRSVLMLAGAVDLKLDKRVVNLMQKEQLKPDYLAINHQHTVPTLVDGDVVLWESRTIMTYLVERYGTDKSLYPENVITRTKIDSLLYFDIGTLVPRWRAIMIPLKSGASSKPSQENIDNLHEALGWLEKNISINGGQYAAGTDRLTVADFALVASVSSYEAANFFTPDKLPILAAWLERCKKNIKNYQKLNGEGAAKMGQFVQSLIKN